MKYSIKTDLHTHTIASDHAFSTVEENVRFAREIGMEAIAITDHATAMDDSPMNWHFCAMDIIPPYVDGVRVLRGSEANILDLSGAIDLSDAELEKLEIVIASIHECCYRDCGKEDHTSAYLGALENPAVDILGHSGNPRCRYDIEKVVKKAKEMHKLIEINAHSFDCRQDSIPICREIALACKKNGCGICVDSDAHFSRHIGRFDNALLMLEEIDFPEELIMNRSYKALKDYFSVRKEI